MGYETKMYVCDINMRIDSVGCNGLTYAMPIAMVDLCKVGYDSNTATLIRKQTTKEPVIYFYGSDGTTEIIYDSYDDALGVISIDNMISAMKLDYASSGYRRLAIAISVLESVKNSFDSAYVVTYGH